MCLTPFKVRFSGMELSICIPVYQHNVNVLAKTLIGQASDLQIEFEILLFDDFSNQKIKDANRPLKELPHISYQEMPQNMGRSKIRNSLAVAASGEYLLFLDNDGEIFYADFLADYWQAKVDKGVVCGGTSYPVLAPKGCELHFEYGYNREAKNAKVRNQAGHKGFKSNSFLAHQSVFQKIQFDESLKQYGHEDTLFGLELKKNQIPIKHIDNPILHNQLELNANFLDKTTQGLENMAKIARKLKSEELDFFPMYKLAVKLKKLGLAPLVLAFYRLRKKAWLRNLNSKNPSLKTFDIFRLGYLLELMKEK